MVSGQKDILKEFSQRKERTHPKPLITGAADRNNSKTRSNQQLLVDDSYYIYVLHRREIHQVDGGASGASQEQTNLHPGYGRNDSKKSSPGKARNGSFSSKNNRGIERAGSTGN